MKLFTAFFVIVLMFQALPVASDEIQLNTGKKKPVWTIPESIDPLSKEAGDFIDQDPAYYDWRAQQFYKEKNFKKAAQYYLFALSFKNNALEPIYNLACCYAQMGEGKLAALYLSRAVDAGLTNSRLLNEDKDLDPVREDPDFSRVLTNVQKYLDGLGEAKYIAAPSLIKYRVQLPDGYKKGKAYPLVIGLHGWGDNVDNFIRLWRGYEEDQLIFVTPETPYMMQPGIGNGGLQYTWDGPRRDPALWPQCDRLTVEYIHHVAETMRQEYNPSGIYLMGFSQGTAYAYLTGIEHPSSFEGVIAMAGILPEKQMLPEEKYSQAKNLPVFIGHGRQDQAIKTESSLQAKKRLEDYGFSVTYFEFDAEHRITRPALERIWKWIQKEPVEETPLSSGKYTLPIEDK